MRRGTKYGHSMVICMVRVAPLRVVTFTATSITTPAMSSRFRTAIDPGTSWASLIGSWRSFECICCSWVVWARVPADMPTATLLVGRETDDVTVTLADGEMRADRGAPGARPGEGATAGADELELKERSDRTTSFVVRPPWDSFWDVVVSTSTFSPRCGRLWRTCSTSRIVSRTIP